MPVDGHLHDGHVVELRQQKNFNVENPAFHVDALKDVAGGSAGKHLEAALRVADAAHAENADEDVEDIHQQIAESGALKLNKSVRKVRKQASD